MKKFTFIATALVAVFAVLFSCNKQEDVDPSSKDNPVSHFKKGQTVTISGSAAQTKVSSGIVGEDMVFNWEEGDKIYVIVGENEPAEFTLTKGAGTDTGEFTGTMPGEGEEFTVKFPDGKKAPDLTSQTYKEGGLPHNMMSFEGKGTIDETGKGKFSLANQDSFLCLNLKGTDSYKSVGEIVVETLDNSGELKTYSLDCSTSKDLDTGKATPFFLVIPKGTYNVTVKVFDKATPKKNLIFSFKSTEPLVFDVNSAFSVPVKEVKPGEMSLSFTKGETPITEDSHNLLSLDSYVSPTLEGAPAGATIKYSSSKPAVATVDETSGTVTPVAVGETTITATVTAEGYEATDATYTLTVTSKKLARNLSFTTTSYNKTFGDEPFTNTTLTGVTEGTIAYESDKLDVASVDPTSGEVTIVGAGNAKITVKATGSDRYDDGEASFTVSVSTSGRTFSFEEEGPVNKTYGDSNFTNAIKGQTDGTKTYSSNPESVATVDQNGEVTIRGAGEATISVSITGSTKYADGSASYTLKVAKKDRTLSFTTAGPIDKTYGDAKFTNTLKAGSETTGGTVTYSSESDKVTVKSNNGEVTINGAGDGIIIKASVTASDNYNAGEVTYTLNVAKKERVANFKDANKDLKKGNTYTNQIKGKEANTENPELTYSSSDSSKASVAASGVVTANSDSGSVTISCKIGATTSYKEKTITYTVTLKK